MLDVVAVEKLTATVTTEAAKRSLLRDLVVVVRARWTLGVATVGGAIMHAVGHAMLAAAGGMLAQSLAGATTRVSRSTTRLASSITDRTTAADLVLFLAVCGVFAALAKMVGGALSAWAEARLAAEVGARVRLEVLDGVLSTRARPRHSDHAGTHGARIAALTTHIHEIERGVAFGLLAELRSVVQLVPLAILLVVLAPRLAGSAVVALATFGVLAFALRRAFKRAHRAATASAGALVDAADEAVKHADLWATYGAKRRIRAHVAAIGDAIARTSGRIRVRASLLSSTSEVTGALALVLVLLLAARGSLGVDHGTVVPFAIAFFLAYKPLRDLVEGRIARARGDEALRAALASATLGPPERTSPARAWPLATLVLDGVKTAHGAHAPITVAIAPGAVVAIVGASGAGKTSLLRALLGLDALAAGTVRWGDERLDGAGCGPAERPFAWVPQDAPVVGDTLAVNVALGASDAANVPDHAALLADLGAPTLASALGDEVLVTRRALSGGERQWIAMARALATGLPVLLLDEPTSALDGAAQTRLLDAVARLRQGRSHTVILVTHRPEPLALADIVIRLEA